MPGHNARQPQPVLSRTAIVHLIAVLSALCVKLGAGNVSAWLDAHSTVIAAVILVVSPFVSGFLASRHVTPLSSPKAADGTRLVPESQGIVGTVEHTLAPLASAVAAVSAMDVEAALAEAEAIFPAPPAAA